MKQLNSNEESLRVAIAAIPPNHRFVSQKSDDASDSVEADFKIAERGVWLEARPYHEDYTWTLIAYTVRLVEKELQERG